MTKRKGKVSNFYCTSCGQKGMPIVRQKGKEREDGHLKKLYCIYCMKERNMVEVKEGGKYSYETFINEFGHGNFDKEGNRILSWKNFTDIPIRKSERSA